jgi:hypothetical protein
LRAAQFTRPDKGQRQQTTVLIKIVSQP